MIRVTAWDMVGGENKEVLGDFESIQITRDTVRDDADNRILFYYAHDMTWFDESGNGWYDWTVEVI